MSNATPEPAPDRALLADALERYHVNDWAGAIACCQQLVEQYPLSAAGWHLWGLSELRRGDLENAIEFIGRAIFLGPVSAVYFNHLGAAQEAKGQLRAALRSFQSATKLNPRYVEAHANQATIWERCGELVRAEAALRKACADMPPRDDLLGRWVRLLSTLNRRTEALQVLRTAIVAAPQSAVLQLQLGHLLLEADRIADATCAFEAATRLAPAMADAWFHLGNAYSRQGRAPDAREAFAKAIELRPDKSAWRLRRKLVSPAVLNSSEEIANFQSQLQVELDADEAGHTPITPDDLLAAGIYPPFAINFQGRQTRSIKERIATLVRGQQSLPKPRVGVGKPRIGFVVTSGHEGLFCRCTGGIVDRLDRNEFEVFVIASMSSLPFLKRELRSDITFIALPPRYDQVVETLKQARCDLLYHWEVGSDALNYILPLAQAAAVQCTSWGTQVTSGLQEVDYYLSSQWIERSDADGHYTESLIRLESLPTWQRRMPSPPATDKSYFGWSSRQRVYVCPQNLLKIHPDQDPLFARILDADPEAIVVLKQSHIPGIARELQARFERSLQSKASRVVMLPWLSLADYYRLIAVADVVLDPLHYSAGSSCYDMLSLVQPVITLPGELNVGRFTQACYRYIDYPELIASDQDEYVRLALKVAQDADYRHEVREQLRARIDSLFEDDRAVVAHASFFRTAIEQARL
ncbi:MAG TPA: tetratricopeptide repeat protein [Pirellulaceae bacterium]|nr:tetratricopeptide repeat protein [Pirellulaceae bacterium]